MFWVFSKLIHNRILLLVTVSSMTGSSTEMLVLPSLRNWLVAAHYSLFMREDNP